MPTGALIFSSPLVVAETGVRQLDDVERHMYLRNWMDGADILTLGAIQAKSIPAWQVEAALDVVQRKYSILRSRIIETRATAKAKQLEKDFEYEVVSHPPKPILRVQSVSLPSKCDDEFFGKIIEEEINAKVDASEAVWRTRLIQFPDEDKSMFVRFRF